MNLRGRKVMVPGNRAGDLRTCIELNGHCDLVVNFTKPGSNYKPSSWAQL